MKSISSCIASGAASSSERCLGLAWTPKVCNIMAFMAVLMGLGLLLYILWGLRDGGILGA